MFIPAEQPQSQDSAQKPYKRPRRTSRIADARRVEARLLRHAEAELRLLAGDNPTPEQEAWISKASVLQVMLHKITRQVSSVDLLPTDQLRLFAALSEQHTRLTDRIKAGAPLRKHERVERPEAPDAMASLIEAASD